MDFLTKEEPAHIDHFLALSQDEWDELEEMAVEIGPNPSTKYESYIEELPLFNEHLKYLRQMADEGRLNDQQNEKYQRLLLTVDKLRPIWKRLLQIK